jgi:hypothetical protein
VQDRQLYSIEEARALLRSIGRNTIYVPMRTASLPSVVIGRRRFSSVDSISAFIAAASTIVSPTLHGARQVRSARQMTLVIKTQIVARSKRELIAAS